jgi:tetratricopeptide (TPR) repeat protein
MDTIRGITRAIALVGGLLALCPAPSSAWAATTAEEPSDADTAVPTEESVQSVEVLLDRLALAKSESEADALEQRIVRAWNNSGSDTVDLLAARAGRAMKEQRYTTSLQYLDTIIELKPDFAEGWNMRATVYYLIDEYELSLADIQHVLALQPRHFGALSGLGMIFRDLDQPEKALEAFRQVLTIHPFFGNARESVEKLEPEVEGREI